MAFVPEGQADSSQARSAWVAMQRAPVPEGRSRLLSVPDGATIRRIWGDLSPRRGYRIQPRVSTLGNIQEKRFALKGREITWAKGLRLLPKRKEGYLLGRETISQWLK